MQENFKPFLVQDQETLNQILYKLRIETWLAMGVFKEGEFKPEDFVDEHDNHAYHWAIKKDNKVIAAARMCVHNSLQELPDSECYKSITSEMKSPIASFNRLIVTPEYQRNGLGRSLDSSRINEALERNCKTILISATQATRVNSLLAQGFTIIGKCDEMSNSTWLARIVNKLGSVILKKDL